MTARLRMHKPTTQTIRSILDAALPDPDTFAAGLQSEGKDFAELSDDQKVYFFATMLGFFKHFESMYDQYSNGILEQEAWDAWSANIRMYYQQPGAQTWWNLRKAVFNPKFRDYLESLAPVSPI